MKRILSLLLVFVMMLSVVPANVFAEDAEEIVFSDIEGEEYYAEAVLALVKAGIINGYSDKTFRPEDKITRAEMATIICRLIEKEDEADEAFGKTDYDDVEADHWASGYINVASAEGIIGGDGDGKFRPEDPVLHEEAIKMIVCTFGYGEGIESEGENWADPYLEVAEEKGISEALKGEKGTEAVRGEVALMADNGMKSVEADEEETPAEEVIVNENAPKAPVASRGTGTYDRTQYVDLETETKGATIYYTLDGTDPVEEGEVYVRTLRIYENLTLKAVAEKDGVYSEVITEEYEFTKKIFISSSSKTTIRSAKLETAGAAVTVANVGDVLTLVTDPVSATGTVTWTVGGVDKGITDKTYTVTSLDMGKTIKAQIVGTDSYEGTASAACSVATSVQVTAQDIMSDNADSSPVVLPDAEQTVFLDDAGAPVTVGADATITLSIENTEKTPEEVSEATTIVVQEIINNAVEGVTEEDLSDVTTVAVDVNLTVDETAVHPVGDVTVTLSAAQLGLPEDADLANYTFSAAHTNKNNEDEVVEGTVVTVDNVQYVRFELNGLSTIWIGNIPPRTVSFYNNEDDADNKENSIGSVIVKFGDLTPTLKIPTPSNPGYLFCG
ncbi:MAG: S-layer homology domain-containing protein, partial [Clostridia bacterium]|nr:S-layer homology domain-containing protein [Clostridia bacterium]